MDYSKDYSKTLSYSQKIDWVFSWKQLSSMFYDDKFNIILCNDVNNNAYLKEYVIKNFGIIYQSFFSCLLDFDKEEDTLFFIMLMSKNKNLYTQDHVDIVMEFREVLKTILLKLFQDNTEPYLVLTDEGPVQMESEQLLRRCPGLKGVVRQVEAVAGKKSTVMVHGPSGVGKELVAETLHALSPRRNGPLIKVNCGAIPENLIDSELFGHEKGAFTGASSLGVGFFEQAQGGTIYLDEIGELTPSAQVRLLRVLESREIRRVGGQRRIPLDVRVVAATHRDLWGMVGKGVFREDLWYRLHVFPLEIPPLAQRRADIPVLAEYFYRVYVKELELANPPRLTRALLRELSAREWPGNVRQLRHVMERALIVGSAAGARVLQMAEQDVAPSAPAAAKRGRPAARLPSIVRMEEALKQSDGRIEGGGGAAELLGLKPSTLRKHARLLGLVPRSVQG